MKPALRLVAALLLAAGASALAGTTERPDPKAPAPPASPPPPTGVEGLKDLQPAEGWEQCPKCKKYHQVGYICCCPICGACHPKNLQCRVERAVPLREAVCPVCDKRFNGPLPFRRNAAAGCDHDFCTHSVGHNVVNAVVWICPRCGYTNFGAQVDAQGKELPADFNKALEARTVKAVRERVEPRFKKAVSEMAGRFANVFEELEQTSIPDWFKYEMALETAEARKAPAAEKAKLALEGSYACRRTLLAPVNIPALGMVILASERAIEVRGGIARNPRTVAKAITEIFAESAPAEPGEKKEPAKGAAGAAPKLSPGEAFYLRVRLAGAYDRLGERAMALESLDQADKVLKGLLATPEVLKPMAALVADCRKFMDKEAGFRARALAELRQALLVEGAYAGAEVVPTSYLLGELYRRQEDYPRARTWLTLGGKMAVKEPILASWADEALGLPGMKSAEPDDAEERAALAFLEKLTGKKPVLEPPKPGPEPPALPAAAAPKTCAECLANIAKAYAAYVAKHGTAPPDLPALAAGGFLTEQAAGAFKCPETGTAYKYNRVRQPKGSDAMIIFHADPRKTKCKKCLYADGTIKDLD